MIQVKLQLNYLTHPKCILSPKFQLESKLSHYLVPLSPIQRQVVGEFSDTNDQGKHIRTHPVEQGKRKNEIYTCFNLFEQVAIYSTFFLFFSTSPSTWLIWPSLPNLTTWPTWSFVLVRVKVHLIHLYTHFTCPLYLAGPHLYLHQFYSLSLSLSLSFVMRGERCSYP